MLTTVKSPQSSNSMNRRDFVRAVLIACGALALPPPAKGNEAGPPPRRQLPVLNPKNRLPESIDGFFYVDAEECIVCEFCANAAPEFFKISTAGDAAFVHRQPKNRKEFEICESLIVGCPVSAIGVDLSGIKAPARIQLRLEERHLRDVTILNLYGQVAKGSIFVLQRAVHRLQNERRNKILVNLSHVDYLDSEAASLLDSINREISGNGGQFKLLNPGPNLQAVLASDVITVMGNLQIYEAEKTALRSFKVRRRTQNHQPTKGLFDKIKRILIDELGVEASEVTFNARLEDLGADARDRIKVHMRLEREFKIKIPDREAQRWDQVSAIYMYISINLQLKQRQ